MDGGKNALLSNGHGNVGIYVNPTLFEGYRSRDRYNEEKIDLVRTIGAVGLGFQERATCAHTIRQIVQHVDRHLPVDTSIRDADTLQQVRGALGRDLLVALVNVGLDHDTDQGSLTLAQLVRDLLGDERLVKVVLVGVAVGAVNHEHLALLLGAEGLASAANALAVIVGALAATAQDDEAVLVAGGLGDGGQTLLGHTEETVRVGSSTNSVNCYGQVAVGPVLKADGERQTGGQLTVQLRLGGAGADSAQRDEVGQKLRGDGVEHFTGDGQAGVGQIDVQLARHAQALVDVEGLIDVGVVDQTLPANGGPGLLKVGAHDNAQLLGQLVGEFLQSAGVLESSIGVMDGAGTDDDQETVVALLNNLDSFIATNANSLGGTTGLKWQSSVSFWWFGGVAG